MWKQKEMTSVQNTRHFWREGVAVLPIVTQYQSKHSIFIKNKQNNYLNDCLQAISENNMYILT